MPEPTGNNRLFQPRPEVLLRAAAILCGFLSVVLAAGRAVEATGAGADWSDWLRPVYWVFAGLAASGLLSGLAWLLERLGPGHTAGIARSVGQNSATSAEPAGDGSESGATMLVGDAPPRADDSSRWIDVMSLLRDIRDNALLSESERAEKRSWLADEDFRRGRERIDNLLGQQLYMQARRVAEELRMRYPAWAGAAQELIARVEATRQQTEATDVAAATRRVDELISISAWDRALSAGRELAERHPGNAVSRQLIARVERERDLFETEQRRHMYAEIQRFVTRRRWREALAAAKTYVERFPASNDAQVLIAQMTTLENNACVEDRQQIEAQITDFAKHGRYIEAYNLAMHLIDTYPDSPQADVLRGQIPRLKELAHNPQAVPARVRLTEPLV